MDAVCADVVIRRACARLIALPNALIQRFFAGSRELVPAAVIQGATDADVPLRSAERIADAMRRGGNRDVSVRIFPGVSHSLLPDPSGLSSGWAALPAFVTSPALLDEVADWSARTLSGNRTVHLRQRNAS